MLALQDVKWQPHCSLILLRLVGSEAIRSYLGICVRLLDLGEFMGAVYSPQLSPGHWRTLCCPQQPFVVWLGRSVPISPEDRGIWGGMWDEQGDRESFVNAIHLADDRPKPALVVSKPVSLEPSKSASPSPPPPLIPEVEPVVLSPVTLVPMEPPVDTDTKAEQGEAPPDPQKTLSAITTVPGAAEPPLVPAPSMDTVAVEEEEEEEVAVPLPEPTPQEPVPLEVLPVPVVPSMPAVPPVPAAPSPPPTVPQAPEAPAKPASPSPPPPREEPCPEPTPEANGVLEETPETVPEAPVCQPVPVSEPAPVPTLDSPTAQPEELPLPNGMEGTSKVEPSEEQPESDVSPISEPEEPAQPGTPASPPAEEEEEESEGPGETQERSLSPAPAPSQISEATAQGWERWAARCPGVGVGWHHMGVVLGMRYREGFGEGDVVRDAGCVGVGC